MAEEKKKREKESRPVKELNPDNYKVAKYVFLRNRFYYVLYRNSVMVFLSSIMTTIFSVLFLLFFAMKPVSPQYIPLNSDGTYIKLEPVDVCKEAKDVQRFANDVIKKLYKYDYRNYSDQLQMAAEYFTPEGWDEYVTKFGESGTLEAVKKNKWVVSVNPFEVPVVVSKTTDQYGRCVMDLKTNLNITYIGDNSQNPRGELHIRIARQSVMRQAEGLGVVRVIFVTKQ